MNWKIGLDETNIKWAFVLLKLLLVLLISALVLLSTSCVNEPEPLSESASDQYKQNLYGYEFKLTLIEEGSFTHGGYGVRLAEVDVQKRLSVDIAQIWTFNMHGTVTPHYAPEIYKTIELCGVSGSHRTDSLYMKLDYNGRNLRGPVKMYQRMINGWMPILEVNAMFERSSGLLKSGGREWVFSSEY